jgi:hypothetical protein
MATEAESLVLVEFYGEPLRVETVACVTTQGNFPHPKDQPFVRKDGTCQICGQEVEHTVLEPDDEYRYTRIAHPHTRTMRWFPVDADELAGMLQTISAEFGSGDWVAEARAATEVADG